jgi:hypothetical protein
VEIIDEQIANSLGHSPKNFISAIPRISEAVKIIFQEIKCGSCFNENSEFWNALKNGVRGIIQLVPLLGNAILFTYDKLRITLYIHPKIETELSNQQEVVGMAFDGKPIFSIPISTFNSCLDRENKDANSTLTMLICLWFALKQGCIEKNSKITTRGLAEKLSQNIQNPQL